MDGTVMSVRLTFQCLIHSAEGIMGHLGLERLCIEQRGSAHTFSKTSLLWVQRSCTVDLALGKFSLHLFLVPRPSFYLGIQRPTRFHTTAYPFDLRKTTKRSQSMQFKMLNVVL